VAVAAAAWAYMFLGSEATFWRRAATSGLAIAAYAVAADWRGIGHEFAHGSWPVELAVGLAGGVVLYAVFWIGEQLLVVVAPTLADEVADLYSKRGRVPLPVVCLVLGVAGPAEELFFRGFLWARAGVVVALAVYALVHVFERKVILILAALAGGAWWGALFALTGGLVAPVASHLLWGLMIIAWRPARPTAAAARIGVRVRAAVGR
jgi:membrane protease YdiL (CAAX protease family)